MNGWKDPGARLRARAAQDGENRAWAENGNHTHLGNGNAAVESGRDASDV